MKVVIMTIRYSEISRYKKNKRQRLIQNGLDLTAVMQCIKADTRNYPCSRAVNTAREHGCFVTRVHGPRTRVVCTTPVNTGREHGPCRKKQ